VDDCVGFCKNGNPSRGGKTEIWCCEVAGMVLDSLAWGRELATCEARGKVADGEADDLFDRRLCDKGGEEVVT